MKEFAVIDYKNELIILHIQFIEPKMKVLFASNSYTECDIWIADELARQRINNSLV